MNRINPIYAAILLLLILAILSLNLSGAKSDLKDAQEDYKSTAKLSTDLSTLKEIYEDKTKAKRSIQRILSQSSLSSSKIIQKFKNSTASISSEAMDINALNLLVGKLLNSSHNISSLNIKRLSDSDVAFSMEIKW